MIDSTLGRGTTVTPPAALDGRGRARRAQQGSAVARRHGLLVEDNAAVAAVTRDMLMQIGYAVHTASNAQRALDQPIAQAFNDGAGLFVSPRQLRPIHAPSAHASPACRLSW